MECEFCITDVVGVEAGGPGVAVGIVCSWCWEGAGDCVTETGSYC